jgi:hypothetical protein
MIIYGNNLHEKLQGVAISRDYLKYNTPFCDLVDSPEWQVDIDLALNYHKASYGNLDAANKFVQDLTLNSNTLDWSTIEYYTQKIKYNPAFKSAIKEMRTRWSTPDLFSDDFQNIFNNALKDCLNSPCNLFTETSDSIGRIAQSASTKTTANTFGVGELSASFVNMINGLDETVTNKLPNIFKNAFTEVTAVASKAWENTQAVLAGKENLSAFYDDINNGKSLRDPAKSFRYTPDVQSYYDYSAASSDVLAAIKRELGGCFNRFQYRLRYNPYDAAQNQKSPLGTKSGNVNGIITDENSLGQTKSLKTNNIKLKDQISVDGGDGSDIDSTVQDLDMSSTASLPIILKSYGNSKYSTFAAYIEKRGQGGVMFTDPYDATADDKKTRAGVGSIGSNYLYAKSIPKRTAIGAQILNGVIPENYSGEEMSVARDIADGWDHNLTDEGMETLYPTSALIYNDGVAVSAGLLAKVYNDKLPESSKARKQYVISTGIHRSQKDNQAFIAARVVGTNDWKLYKIIDVNSQQIVNVDFTVGAWKHLLNTNGKQLSDKEKEPIAGTKWFEVKKGSHADLGADLEVKFCQGDINDIKVDLGGGPGLLPSINSPEETSDEPNSPTPDELSGDNIDVSDNLPVADVRSLPLEVLDQRIKELEPKGEQLTADEQRELWNLLGELYRRQGLLGNEVPRT